MSTIGRDIGMGYARSGVIVLVSMLIGFPLGLCGVLTSVWLLTRSQPGAGTILFVLLLWVVPFGIAGALFVATVRRRSGKLDELFVPLGLRGGPYMSFFRQYHGELYGRQVDAFLLRGPFLQIEVGTRLRTRLGITQYQSDTSYFANLVGAQPLTFADPQLQSMSVWAKDETWARFLLGNPEVVAALQRLTALGSSVFTRQQVILRPGAVYLLLSGNRRLFGIDITPEQARLWTDDLVRIANAAEALPEPTVNDDISSSEEFAFKLRRRNPYFELWVGVGILGAFIVAAVLIFGVIFALAGAGAL